MTVPAALSVHNFINKVGADAGFASIIGLALLILLFFAQMRETSTLRRALEEASGRILQLEGRLAQLARAQVGVTAQARRRPAPRGAAAPDGERGRIPGDLARQPPSQGVRQPVFAGAPAGVAAPALGAATKLIPTPEVIAAPAPAVSVPAGVPVGVTALEDTVLAGPGVLDVGANGNAAAGSALGPPPVGVPQTAPAFDEGFDPEGPRDRGGATAPRAQVGEGPLPPVPPRRMLTPGRRRSGRGPSRAARVLAALAGLAIVAVAVVVLISATGSGTSPTKTTGTNSATTPPSGKRHRRGHHQTTAPVFNPAAVTVTVLNGTAINGLAKAIQSELANRGYKSGVTANAAVQTQTSTVVGYLPGNQIAADYVAKALGLSPAAAQPAGQSAVVACAQASAAGTSTTSTTCPANIVVTVGADLRNAASNT